MYKVRRYLEKTSKKISKSSKQKFVYQDRKNLDNFRKENLDNLKNGDVKEMYEDVVKYKNIDRKGNRKYFNKNVYNK